MNAGQIIGNYGIRGDIAMLLSRISQGDVKKCETYRDRFRNDPGISGHLYFRIENFLNKIVRKTE